MLGLLNHDPAGWHARRCNVASFDIGEIAARIAARLAARKNKNWAESDRIRDELAAMGVALKDNKDGTTTWEPKR
jgi:cysteinyl-tRNA synthetase